MKVTREEFFVMIDDDGKCFRRHANSCAGSWEQLIGSAWEDASDDFNELEIKLIDFLKINPR